MDIPLTFWTVVCVNSWKRRWTLHLIYTLPLDLRKKNSVTNLFCGINSLKLQRQLHRIYSSLFPCINLRIIFKPVCKLGRLSKLKASYSLTSLSSVIYKVKCSMCEEFYIGLTTCRLEQRLKEHASGESSALFRHAMDTGHPIDIYTILYHYTKAT